jgi:hypothetical protein
MIEPLPLSRLIDAAYSRLFGNLGTFLRIALTWMAIMTVLAVALAALAPRAWGGQPGNVVIAVVCAGIAIGWHRFVLRQEHRALPHPNTLARYVLLAALAGVPGTAIVLLGAPAAAALLRGLDERVGALTMTAAIILLVVAAAALTCRFLLILPAAAIGDRAMTLRRSWATTRGHAAGIFLGGLATQIPPWLGIGLLTWLLQRGQHGPRHRALQPGIDEIVLAFVGAAFVLLLAALGTALFAGLLSEFYRQLAEDEGEPSSTPASDADAESGPDRLDADQHADGGQPAPAAIPVPPPPETAPVPSMAPQGRKKRWPPMVVR